MITGALPLPLQAPASGWMFQGAWQAADQALIEQTLRERIPNPTRARGDPWVFLAHAATYYAHSAAVHSPNVGFVAATAADLAELLWGHYFALQLGPLAWSPPDEAAPSATRPAKPVEDAPSASHSAWLEQEWRAQDHFAVARALLADGDVAAAKIELERSLALAPATTFFDHKRVETLGDIESRLGNDIAALQQYQRALDLALAWQESWTHAELRLKCAWALLRLGRPDTARDYVETALATIRDGVAETAARRGLNYATALALATLADVHFHQHDSDAAIARARQAAAIAVRLGQAYAEKVRLLTYLAWQLYHHDEVVEARALAQRAQTALDRWMPLDAQYVRSLRTTLATILGPSRQRNERATRVSLPPHAARVAEALAAAGAMQDERRQLTTLHALAPHLTPGQGSALLDAFHLWSEDVPDAELYRVLLSADLAPALADPERTAAAARRLIALGPEAFRMLSLEWLYAESLVRMRDCLEPGGRESVEEALSACASVWCAAVQEYHAGWLGGDALAGLAALLPHLSPAVRQSACLAVEAALLAQLQPQNSSYPDAFLACLPALARCGAGQQVVDLIMQHERQSVRMWIACLAHTGDEAEREAIVETALRGMETWLKYGSSTEVGDGLCWLAPYLRGEQAPRALALATSVRSIAPRVRALAAIARALPNDESRVVYDTAWKAAQRSANADVRGEALTAVVVSMAAPKFGQGPAGE